jgi:hypothetical protein
MKTTLKALANTFGVVSMYTFSSQGCRKLQPWAEIRERLRRWGRRNIGNGEILFGVVDITFLS